MNNDGSSRSQRRRTMWLGSAAMAAITMAGAFVPRMVGAQAALATAGVYGGGAFAMALLTARDSAYPRWAWFGSAGVLALALVLAAVFMPAPLQVKEWASMAWMMPWLYLVMALSPAPAAGVCAPRSARSGTLLMGTSIVFSSILLGICWLER